METIIEEIRSDNAQTADEKMDTDEKQTNCYWWVMYAQCEPNPKKICFNTTYTIYIIFVYDFLAAKIEIWTYWNYCVPHAIDGSTNHALDFSWENW